MSALRQKWSIRNSVWERQGDRRDPMEADSRVVLIAAPNALV
jgi:hypothetical protein